MKQGQIVRVRGDVLGVILAVNEEKAIVDCDLDLAHRCGVYTISIDQLYEAEPQSDKVKNLAAFWVKYWRKHGNPTELPKIE